MIRLPGIRDKGGAVLGAAGPGLAGPWGLWGDDTAPLVICNRPVGIHPHPTVWASDEAAVDWIDAIRERQAEKATQGRSAAVYATQEPKEPLVPLRPLTGRQEYAGRHRLRRRQVRPRRR